MTLLQIIIVVIFVYIFFDIYRRLFDYKRSFKVLLFFNDVINKALNDKGGISREEIREIGKKVLYSRPEGEHERLKSDLLKSGIDFRE